MSEGTSQTMPPPLPGLFVGHVDDLAAALAWVDRWAFAGPPLPGPETRALSLGPAPIPGGVLLDRFGVHLLGLRIDEAGGDWIGPRARPLAQRAPAPAALATRGPPGPPRAPLRRAGPGRPAGPRAPRPPQSTRRSLPPRGRRSLQRQTGRPVAASAGPR
ncbi:MAG: hypothetical protein R3B09_11460 [Nannocystaceae bacterium]